MPNNSYGKANNRNGGANYRQEPPKSIEAEKLPADYIEAAEKVMAERYRAITTSKLRNILSMLMDVYNAEQLRTEEKLTEESGRKLQLARIRIAYECGRDNSTKTFVESAKVLAYLKGIGNSREEAIRYIHYMEALVAYHRFFGGREN